MLNSFLIGFENQDTLRKKLIGFCPQVTILGQNKPISRMEEGLNLEGTLNIVFLLINDVVIENLDKIKESIMKSTSSLICFGANKELAYYAYKLSAIEFILAPYQPQAIINAVHKVEQKIKKLNDNRYTLIDTDQVLGIPTIEGYEFIPINKIIKCEGLQSYTRIITDYRKDIISSNNIGELKKKLTPFGFFSPHKSHIISLKKIRKYSKDGVIFLDDGSNVPLARRRKCEFFKKILHL